ncbi:methyl-accepting chemotaxis protein [Paenibacillus chitinolyticus]|uniref:methyl-accepting chemotaxis protein n=1 Tax=Paenibacillus chitinolyticus TaxID=79263 RepID=UPI0035569B2D
MKKEMLTKSFKGLNRNSLKVKIPLLLLILALVPLLVSEYFLSNQFTSVLRKSIEENQVKITTYTADYISSTLVQKVSTVQSVIQNHTEMGTQTEAQKIAILKTMSENDTEVKIALFADKDGQAVDQNGKKSSLANDETFKSVKDTKKRVVSDIIKDSSSNQYSLKVSAPVIGANGEFAGMLQTSINPSRMINQVNKVKIGETGYAYLMSKEGIYMVHPQTDRIGKPLSDMATPERLELFKKTVLVKEQGQVAYKEKDNTNKAAVYEEIKVPGWRIVVTGNSDEIYSQVDQVNFVAKIIVLVSAIVVVAAAIWLSTFILKPLLGISAMMKRIAGGDLSRRLKVQSQDEMGDVQQNINEMLNSFSALLQKLSMAIEHMAASSQQLSAIATQSADVSQNVNQTVLVMVKGAETQFETAEQTTEAMNEMAAGVTKIADSASTVSEVAQGAVQRVNQGSRDMQDAIHQIQQASEAVEATSLTIKALEESSARIHQVVGFISEIAKQTNLLALNASIEAARAGEHGRGFAVVAQEVKNLAEQTSGATVQINETIKQVLSATKQAAASMSHGKAEVDRGVEQVRNTDRVFEDILKTVSSINGQIQEVSAATQQISAGTEEVAASMQETVQISRDSLGKMNGMSRSTEEQHAGMKEIVISASELTRLASELQELSGKFTVERNAAEDNETDDKEVRNKKIKQPKQKRQKPDKPIKPAKKGRAGKGNTEK